MERTLWDNVTPFERCHTAVTNQWKRYIIPLCGSRQATELGFCSKNQRLADTSHVAHVILRIDSLLSRKMETPAPMSGKTQQCLSTHSSYKFMHMGSAITVFIQPHLQSSLLFPFLLILSFDLIHYHAQSYNNSHHPCIYQECSPIPFRNRCYWIATSATFLST